MRVASLSVLRVANKEMGEPVYDVRLLPETAGPMRSSIGFGVATEPLDDTNFNTVIIGGSAAMCRAALLGLGVMGPVSRT